MQTDKRNAYKTKHADKAAGKNNVTADPETDGQDRDGQPSSKKARLDPDESMGIDRSELPEADTLADDDVAEDDGHDDEPDDDDDDDADQEERLEVEEQLEEPEAEDKEAADEALDNGEDSD
jgi:DNA polymerase epsilon subunit 3